eukprot:14168.XXX_400244_400348_1 [CDS] Oithona nana genome sequencing.
MSSFKVSMDFFVTWAQLFAFSSIFISFSIFSCSSS